MVRAKKGTFEDKELELQQDEDQEKVDVNVEETPQKKYVVVHDFKDLKDENIVYIKGDIYPRKADAIVSAERIKELSSTKNKIGSVLIQERD
ncbi:hypothetical protein ACQRXC_03935 [Niallia taxi]|uniref:hypothetical protein n=1 Tax=Niallia taxi TaxID=2499688 RepID=UPI003F62A0B8